jgi:hypothetical protein
MTQKQQHVNGFLFGVIMTQVDFRLLQLNQIFVYFYFCFMSEMII